MIALTTNSTPSETCAGESYCRLRFEKLSAMDIVGIEFINHMEANIRKKKFSSTCIKVGPEANKSSNFASDRSNYSL